MPAIRVDFSGQFTARLLPGELVPAGARTDPHPTIWISRTTTFCADSVDSLLVDVTDASAVDTGLPVHVPLLQSHSPDLEQSLHTLLLPQPDL